jgi:hypothetical protein
MSGAIPPLPQNAFMAWCSVKKIIDQKLMYYIQFQRLLNSLYVLNGYSLNKYIYKHFGPLTPTFQDL